ncbi:MAG: hypothetical protein C4534_02255 [Gaiellales bacterium]|nr:MAG: hypothetical protein C4534_02255 [Gaiellales bacterium]
MTVTGASIKSIILTLVLALVGGTGALAATSGQIPLVPGEFLGSGSVNSDGYPEHGQDVSAVASDKDAVGTKTNPSGKVIENHGQAVREAAHDKGGDGFSDNSNDSASDDTGDSAGADMNGAGTGSGGPPAHSNAGGNAGNGSGNGNGGNGAGNGSVPGQGASANPPGQNRGG